MLPFSFVVDSRGLILFGLGWFNLIFVVWWKNISRVTLQHFIGILWKCWAPPRPSTHSPSLSLWSNYYLGGHMPYFNTHPDHFFLFTISIQIAILYISIHIHTYPYYIPDSHDTPFHLHMIFASFSQVVGSPKGSWWSWATRASWWSSRTAPWCRPLTRRVDIVLEGWKNHGI